MTSRRIATFFAVAMLTVVAAVSAAPAQNTVGTITQLQGTANVQRAGATIAAARYLPIFLHDKIVTDPNASLTIGLVDNSSLQLGAGASSTLTIDESVLVSGVGAPSKVGLLGGHLHSIIVGAMRGISSTTFQVNTPNAVGAIRGTEWSENFSEEPRSGFQDCRQFTDVDIVEGTVQVCNREGPLHCTRECRDVAAGHHVTIACCAFVETTAGLGAFGAAALGVGAAGGIGVGIAAGVGAFSGPSSGPSPPTSPSK